MAPRVVYDTSFYVEVLRSSPFATRHREGYQRRLPVTYFSGVVVQELLAGARDSRARRVLDGIYRPFERADRTLAPGYATWKEAGRALGRLGTLRPDLRSLIRSGLVNDLLIALSARAIGAAVVTRDREHFALIGQHCGVIVEFA